MTRLSASTLANVPQGVRVPDYDRGQITPGIVHLGIGALVLAQEAIAAGADQSTPMERRMFFYMPFMHAESLVIQEEGCQYFVQFGEDALKFMTGHRDCIARFGRFPFRNKALGRQSTPAEVAYMAEAGDRVF